MSKVVNCLILKIKNSETHSWVSDNARSSSIVMLSIQNDTKSLELVFAGASRMRNLLQKSNGLYHCPQCDHTNRNRTDLERHIETYHLDLEYPCEYCDRVFKTRRRYQRHVRSHHPGMNYRIAWLFITDRTLEARLSILEEFIVKCGKGCHQCTACGYQGSRKCDVVRHVEAKHLKCEFKCPFCQRASTTSRRHREHLRICQYRCRWKTLKYTPFLLNFSFSKTKN